MEKQIRNVNEGTDVSCETCVLRKKGCEQAQEGSFCTRWQSREPEPRGKDPNQAWLQGEEADF